MATTAIPTATIVEATSTIMLPGMSYPEDASRVVRFDNECVLIPESSRSKRSMVLTKSYSLPLWKKRGSQMSDSDAEDGVAGSRGARSSSPEESRVVLRVPIPTFRRRSSRSPTRGRSVSASPVVPAKLPPCLVNRAPSASPTITRTTPLSPVRRPSLPPNHIHTHRPRKKDEMTVPLRDCCPDCERITEESLKEGDLWQEKFSRAAKRRRSASLDYQDMVKGGMVSPLSLSTSPPSDFDLLPDPLAVHRRAASFDKEFSLLSIGAGVASGQGEALNLNEPESPAISRFGASAGTFALTVDEVDKRRRSFDFSKEHEVTSQLQSRGLLSPPSPSSPSFAATVFHSPGSPYSGSHRHPNSRNARPRDRDISSSSTASMSSSVSGDRDDVLHPLPDILHPRRGLRSPGPARSSPIDEEEEDDAQLFPLPRRSPSGSRSGTPSPRLSPRASPVPTPNGSSVELSGAGRGKNGSSKDSLVVERGSTSTKDSNSSQESLLKASLSRKMSSGGASRSRSGTGGAVSTSTTPTNTPKGKVPASSASTPSSSSASASTSTSNSGAPAAPALAQLEDRSTSPTPTKKRLSVSTTSSSSTTSSLSNPPMSPRGPRPSSKVLAAAAVTKERLEMAAGQLDVLDKEVVVMTSTPLSSLSMTVPAPAPTVSSMPLVPLRPAMVSSESSASASTSSSVSTSASQPDVSAHTHTPTQTSSIPIPIPSGSNHTHTSPSQAQSTNATSPPGGHGHIPSSPSQRRKLSFTAPFVRAGEALREVGADVLKGVSSMSGGPGVVG